MKHTPQQLKRQAQIKQKLKDYYKYFESDFYQEGENIYMNCQDNVGITVRDAWEDLELTRKENIGF